MNETNVEELVLEEQLKVNEDGSYDEVEVYRDKRSGNIVTHPSKRSKGSVKDPRQDICWDYYIRTWKAGAPNAQEAARIAGYSPNTCLNVTNLKWFKERKQNLKRSNFIPYAERNITRILNMGFTKMKTLEDGTTEEVFDADKARIVADMTKLIVTTLGKDLGYSSKTEVKVSSLPTPILQLEAKDITPQLEESNEIVED